MSRHRNLPLYSIGAVSNLTGLSERRIRYYEQAGLIRPARTAGNQRRYSQADVDRLLEIKGLLQQGLHLDDIRRRLLERRGREETMGPPDLPAALAAAEPWSLPVPVAATVRRAPGRRAGAPRSPDPSMASGSVRSGCVAAAAAAHGGGAQAGRGPAVEGTAPPTCTTTPVAAGAPGEPDGGPAPAVGRIDRLFRGPAPAVPGVGTARCLYPALDPAVLYQARRRQRRGDGPPGQPPGSCGGAGGERGARIPGDGPTPGPGGAGVGARPQEAQRDAPAAG
ncbi:MAG TPA: MerR family transcriptional regulator [Thermaerobacter sp.]